MTICQIEAGGLAPRDENHRLTLPGERARGWERSYSFQSCGTALIFLLLQELLKQGRVVYSQIGLPFFQSVLVQTHLDFVLLFISPVSDFHSVTGFVTEEELGQ